MFMGSNDISMDFLVGLSHDLMRFLKITHAETLDLTNTKSFPTKHFTGIYSNGWLVVWNILYLSIYWEQ